MSPTPHHSGPAAEPGTLARLRAILLGTLVLGMFGTGAELLLLGHIEGWQQLIPVVLLGVGLVVCLLHAVRPTAGGVRLVQAVMMAFIISGGAGVYLHYRGNVEFELEMYPEMAGMELISSTMTGATPVLAPGTMVVFGLVGLAAIYRHPRTSPRGAVSSEE